MHELNNAGQESSSEQRSSPITRRSIMKACGAGVVGSVVSFSGTAAADRKEPYDGGRTTMIDDADGEDFAEVHTAVTGPKEIDSNFGHANMALATPVSYSDTEYNEGLDNVEVSCELTNNPIEGTGFDFDDIEPYSPGENQNSGVLQYAIDVAWETLDWLLGFPSPSSLIMDSGGTSVSERDGEFCIEREPPSTENVCDPPGAEWRCIFHNRGDSDGAAVGDWVWELTTSADVGYWDPQHGRGPGFHVVGDFEHTHEIELTIVSSE